MSGNDKLPISLIELEQRKESLEQMNIDIGTTLEMTKEVREILGNGNYKEDQILVKTIEILGHNLFKVGFTFPVYDVVTDDLPNEHVSINQMQGAIVQGLFTCIGFGIKQNGLNSPMSYETFLLNRGEVLYRRDERTMRKKLNFGEKAYIIFKLHPIIKKGKIYSIITDMIKDKDTFLDGKVECVLQDKYLFDEREKANCKTMEDNILPETMIGDVRTRFEVNANIKETISMTDKKEEQDKE